MDDRAIGKTPKRGEPELILRWGGGARVASGRVGVAPLPPPTPMFYHDGGKLQYEVRVETPNPVFAKVK